MYATKYRIKEHVQNMSDYNSNDFEKSAIKKSKTYESRSEIQISSIDQLAVNFIMIIWRMECKYLSSMENIYQLVLKNFCNNHDSSPIRKKIYLFELRNLFKLSIFKTLACDYLNSFPLGQCKLENEDFDFK